MTNDDIRHIAAEIKRELQIEYRVIVDAIRRVEHKVEKLNGDVSNLKNDKLAREIREDERAQESKRAAELVAAKTAKAISDRDRSRRWWISIIGAATAAIVAITALTGLLAQYIYKSH